MKRLSTARFLGEQQAQLAPCSLSQTTRLLFRYAGLCGEGSLGATC